jgi:hypothetical protein
MYAYNPINVEKGYRIDTKPLVAEVGAGGHMSDLVFHGGAYGICGWS